MALGDVVFIKGQGGLGRALPGKDHFSGKLFYSGSLPSGFDSSNRIKKFFSIKDAEAAGIVLDYSDETLATATYTCSTLGSNGDTLELKVAEWRSTVSLGIYTKSSSESTLTLQAAAIAAVINAGTSTHGYTATSSVAVVTITARPKTGVYLNAASKLTKTIVGTHTGTIADFSGGVGTFLGVMWYHINQFFNKNPKGVLWVGIYAQPSTLDFAEVGTIQDFANGEIRNMGVYVKHAAFSTTQVNYLQAQVDALAAVHKPLSIIYNPDISGTGTLTALADLSALEDDGVSVVIGQDGNGLGYDLFKQLGKSVGCLGAALGSVSLAKVNESIGWIGKFDQVDTDKEMDVAAFSNGTNFSSLSSTTLNAIDDLRYIFLIKKVGKDGTFFNSSHTAIALSSDYAYIEDNRTIDKAIRGVYLNLIDQLNGPLDKNSDGTLADSTIAYLEGLSEQPLEQMSRDGEIANGGFNATIDPAQNVDTEEKLVVAIQLVHKGVSRNIEVGIGYTSSIS